MPWCPGWGWWTQQRMTGVRPASGLWGDSFQPWEAAGALRCWMKTSSLVSHPGLCWPGLGTAADPCGIVAPSAGVPLSDPEPHQDSGSQFTISAIPFPISSIFPFLHLANLTIWLYMQKKYLTCRAFKFCFPAWVQQGSLCGWDRLCMVLAGDLLVPGKNLSWSRAVPLKLSVFVTAHMHCSFCGKYFFLYRPVCS